MLFASNHSFQFTSNKPLIIALSSILISSSGLAYSATTHHDTNEEKASVRAAPMPRIPQTLPPSREQQLYNLAPSNKIRTDLFPSSVTAQQNQKNLSSNESALQTTPSHTSNSALRQLQTQAANSNPECHDMQVLASHHGADLADYIAQLPDFECGYPLFSLDAASAATVFSNENFRAVAERFAQEASGYDATNIKLNNLLIYLRAGFYLTQLSTIASPEIAVRDFIRPALKQLLNGKMLFKNNPLTSNTASEATKLISNMSDEAYYLPSIKTLITRYTNSSSNPHAALALREATASRGFTGLLTVLYYAQFNEESRALEAADSSYTKTLFKFIRDNKKDLIGTSDAYQLADAANEAFRFMQYESQFSTVKAQIKAILATTSLQGNDQFLWINAASSADYYDWGNCAEYGTCGFEKTLADIILKDRFVCSPTITIRAQAISQSNLQASCDLLAKEESFFHKMMKTNHQSVADDNNTALEVNVFHNYTEYSKYAGILFGISTNNGGMYLEGDPSAADNQARFIAHEASWLLPKFSIWNLEHEYIHYLDGRFNMYGDFGTTTSVPNVFYIEGLAEYLSLKNDNQAAIDAAKTGKYSLSFSFTADYSMDDYVARAYRWGYMATRFMFENHREDIDAILGMFRQGNYTGYWSYMQAIGTQYDDEFAAWVQTATTSGCPVVPGEENAPCSNVVTPPVIIKTPCNSSNQLNNSCFVDFSLNTNDRLYASLILPAGAKNLKIWSEGGSGDIDLYVNLNSWPNLNNTDTAFSVTNGSNQESISITTPVANQWYLITVLAKQDSSNVKLYASFE